MSEDLMQSTKEEQEFWCNAVRGLPGLEGFSGTGYDANGERIPWGTGPHSLRAFREVMEIVNPLMIYEIGFNLGYASAVFLKLSDTTGIVSCDISIKEETIAAASFLKKTYSNRFTYFNRNTSDFLEWIAYEPFGLAFVDGSHLYKDVYNDISFCKTLGIPYLLFDDILPNFGETQKAIDEFPELELVKSWGNIALYKNHLP